MKVYPLHIGDTKVAYGQFYGGLQGWSGLQGFWRFATDKSHYIVVPIHAYLIEHPQAGTLLVDTGISWSQAIGTTSTTPGRCATCWTPMSTSSHPSGNCQPDSPR